MICNMQYIKWHKTSVAFGQATSSGFWGSLLLPLGQNPLSPFLAPRWTTQSGKISHLTEIPYLASCTPSKWSLLSWETVGFVVVHGLRDLPLNWGQSKRLPNLISSVGISKDSVGVVRNSFTKLSSISSLFESLLSWPIFSWNFSQILFSELGGFVYLSHP